MMYLMRYDDATTIRPATIDEWRESVRAARSDGGRGVIEVDGQDCYVQGYPDYRVTGTVSGWAVHRPDGCYTEFRAEKAARKARERLIDGEDEEDDYDWRADTDPTTR